LGSFRPSDGSARLTFATLMPEQRSVESHALSGCGPRVLRPTSLAAHESFGRLSRATKLGRSVRLRRSPGGRSASAPAQRSPRRRREPKADSAEAPRLPKGEASTPLCPPSPATVEPRSRLTRRFPAACWAPD
jgi:hypothetical protein